MQKFAFFFVALLLSVPVAAQDVPMVEVFGGYQYLHFGGNTSLGADSGQGFNGWNAAAAYNFGKYLGVEGDFSGSYADIGGVSTRVYTYGGGPVVFMNSDRIKPFAHVLFGGAKLSGSESGVSISWDGYTVMAGGGVDARVGRNLAVRVAQFDWIYYHFGSKTIANITLPSFSGSNNVRFSTGIVLRF